MSERDLLAGEYALRLLNGEELLAARRLLAEDPDFAAAVAEWEERFAPLAGELPEQALPADMWARIEAAIAGGANEPVSLNLRRKLRRWQGLTGLSTAAAVAASLALFLVVRSEPPAVPVPAPVERVSAPVLVASVATEQSGSLAVTYVPDRGDLLVVPAALEVPSGRSRQLWLIPEGGTPISLGLVAEGDSGPRRIAAVTARQFARGATIAISDEPEGGSPTGQPTGTVLGTGVLQQG
ncbi:anti-sigma factor [Sphingomonas swuensis]|uniref:Anti-sigma factor n=1 Tax=Sphingomonas swuensis TaxID=977800 RepID=A0ABP7SYX4_9SPHN